MIKSALISVWAMALMAGSVYYFAVMSGSGAGTGHDDASSLDTYELQTSSFPVVRDNEIRGYIVMSALFSIVSENTAKLTFPLDHHINDALIETVFADKEIDVFQIEKIDLGSLKERMIARINRDRELVRDIKFKGFDYLSKNEIRDMKMRRY